MAKASSAGSKRRAVRAASDKSFAEYGVRSFAYVKRTIIQGKVVYAVHAADGTYLWHNADAQVARARARRQDIEPLSVH